MATGPGYFDAYNIWFYGEDDNIALVSDTLNKLSTSLKNNRIQIDTSITSLTNKVDAIPVVAFTGSTTRDAYFGIPANETQRLALQNKGASAIRLDLGIMERYFATYNGSTNPGGKTTPGWYAVEGQNQALTTGLTMASGYSLGGDFQLLKSATGVVTANLNFTKSSAIGANELMATLPTGWRPNKVIRLGAVYFGSGNPGGIQINTDGTIFSLAPGLTGMTVAHGSTSYPTSIL